ncbi:MAG TPA: helix-turn-helix domain-containing protein, partial [Candidatus Thermoplasmatota archaeon]|nr:helix-turn-helix domain-containing protein [Candidatus Thermoplasmatota archaeon]
MDPSTVLELDSRRRIYEFVRAKPGTHLRAIARGLASPLGTTLFHLDCLTRTGVVVVRMDGRYKRFFASDTLGRREKDYVAALHRAVPRRLLAVVVRGGARTQRELARELVVSRSTVSFHLSVLVRQGILACERRRPENVYV